MNPLTFYKNKKVFLTGHTGFKGTWLSRILIRAGANVTGYSLPSPTVPSLFGLTETEKDMTSIIGDVRDLEKLKSAMNSCQPEIIFHLAAQPLVRLSYKEPVATYETNVMGTVNILESIRSCHSIKSVVNVTTDKVYLNREWIWGYREDEELCGYDPYSNSKSCSELVTYSYKNSFFNYDGAPAISTARSGNVIGGGDYALDRIIPDCIKATVNNQEIIIRNPHSTRPYQHVLECLYGYLLLAQRQAEDNSLCGSYNFGPDDDSCITTGDLVSLFCRSWGLGASWRVQGDGGPHEANFLKLDCSKAKSVLGWAPEWNIQTAVEKIVDWQQGNSQGISEADSVDKQIDEYFNNRRF